MLNTPNAPQCHVRSWPAWTLALGLVCAGLAQAQAATAAPAASAPAATASLVTAPAPATTPATDTVASVPALSASSVTVPITDASVRNPYGLESVWAQGDGVARTTILLLAVMSVLSWYIIIAKWLQQRRLTEQTMAGKKMLASAEPLSKRIETLPTDNPLRFVADGVMAAARRHDSLSGQVDMASWLGQDIASSVTSLQMRSQEGLSVLATVGSTAPFVGLFGTVWGIYNALVTIGTSGQASIDKVAGPVGEALIMTALGLAVAVPAVLGYNWLVRRNRVTLHAVRSFGSELHTQLLVLIDKSQRARAAAQQAD